MLKEVKKGGAEELLGDTEKAGPALRRLHIVRGTETRLWRCETFGPVLIVAIIDAVNESV